MVHLVARAAGAALQSKAIIAALPGGRGNDFVRALGLARDPIVVATRLALARVRPIDIGMVGERAFLGVVSAGFDAAANGYANQSTVIRGPMVYAYGAVRAVATDKMPTFRLTLDDEVVSYPGWSVAVGNSGRYGGGMRVCPRAKLDDGMLDVVTIGQVPRRSFLPMLTRMYSGTHIKDRNVNQYRAATVRIEAPDLGTADVYADGDPIAVLPCEVTVRPGAVRFLV